MEIETRERKYRDRASMKCELEEGSREGRHEYRK